MVLNDLESSIKLPKIKAFRLSKEEFLHAFDSFVIPLAKKQGYSKSQIDKSVNSGGISISFPDE